MGRANIIVSYEHVPQQSVDEISPVDAAQFPVLRQSLRKLRYSYQELSTDRFDQAIINNPLPIKTMDPVCVRAHLGSLPRCA